MMMEVGMKWLKSLFIQRFSVFDLAVFALLVTSDVSLIVLIPVLALISAIDVAMEHWLEIRTKNGNTQWSDL